MPAKWRLLKTAKTMTIAALKMMESRGIAAIAGAKENAKIAGESTALSVTTAVVVSALGIAPALVLKRTKVSNPRGSGRPLFFRDSKY
jgi:hypothetical protein